MKHLRHFRVPPWFLVKFSGISIIIIQLLLIVYLANVTTESMTSKANYDSVLRNQLQSQLARSTQEFSGLKKEHAELASQDQYVINQELNAELGDIKKTYVQAVTAYEELVKFREQTNKTEQFDKLFTQSLILLKDRHWASASANLTKLEKDIAAEQVKIAATFTIPQNVPVNNAPPGSGYSRQQVQTDIGSYMISLVAGDLGSTRVIVDTASDGNCGNDCPVLSLGDYVSRNGAFAGINGSYFCPASYPSCAGKTNTFDTLLMNKNKVYFNSDNNVYSTVPAVIFGNGWVRFVGQSLEWGRDTSIDGVIANQPLLLMGNNVMFGGDGDPKKGSKAGRSFVANKGNTVFIGVVHSATVAEAAVALKALGMENAINLDSGGSTALWSGGYKVGPGRNLPNVILFVRK